MSLVRAREFFSRSQATVGLPPSTKFSAQNRHDVPMANAPIGRDMPTL
jgi:hypothetical protein